MMDDIDIDLGTDVSDAVVEEPEVETLSDSIDKAFDDLDSKTEDGVETNQKIDTPAPQKNVEEFEAPSTFTKEQKEFFKTLPPETKSELLRLETSRQSFLTKQFQELDNYKKTYQEIETVLKPIENNLHLQGTTPAQFIRQMIAADRLIAENPKAAIRSMIDNLGLTEDDIFGDEASSQVSPEIEALKQEVAYLRQKHNDVEHRSRDAAIHDMKSRIGYFAQERDKTTGELLRPEFQSMIADPNFSSLVKFNFNSNPNSDINKVLETSYLQFLASNPHLRQVREDAKKDSLARSQRASKSLSQTGGTVGKTSSRSAKNLSDAIDLAWADLGGD
jgi:hypothetical protein